MWPIIALGAFLLKGKKNQAQPHRRFRGKVGSLEYPQNKENLSPEAVTESFLDDLVSLTGGEWFIHSIDSYLSQFLIMRLNQDVSFNDMAGDSSFRNLYNTRESLRTNSFYRREPCSAKRDWLVDFYGDLAAKVAFDTMQKRVNSLSLSLSAGKGQPSPVTVKTNNDTLLPGNAEFKDSRGLEFPKISKLSILKMTLDILDETDDEMSDVTRWNF